jgi:hypothetical protein
VEGRVRGGLEGRAGGGEDSCRGQPSTQQSRRGNCRRCPMGGGTTTATTVAGAIGPGEPLAAQVGKPLSLAQGSAAYPESVSSS